jgi:hypothetical protein
MVVQGSPQKGMICQNRTAATACSGAYVKSVRCLANQQLEPGGTSTTNAEHGPIMGQVVIDVTSLMCDEMMCVSMDASIFTLDAQKCGCTILLAA